MFTSAITVKGAFLGKFYIKTKKNKKNKHFSKVNKQKFQFRKKKKAADTGLYCIYPKYWSTLTLYYVYSKFYISPFNKSIDVSKELLDERKTV